MPTINDLLEKIVSDNLLHAKWLNTLSYLENCGARKIALAEHPTLVKKEMLKHAEEEFRHAYYLKKQIPKLVNAPFHDYSLSLMLGGICSRHYLNRLDLFTSRLLKKNAANKQFAYILVTYAIEKRAEMLYPKYHEILKKTQSKIHVKSIILEEEEHLQEMEKELTIWNAGKKYVEIICKQEEILYEKWLGAIHLSY
ncbi:MAG: hypothetical protein KAR79_02655 [Simkaniaceae bacterium]|nr:hypothetical protein [Simkaniaceae bacterium]